MNLSPAVVSSCAEDLVTYCAGYEKDKDDWGCLQVGVLWVVVLLWWIQAWDTYTVTLFVLKVLIILYFE